MFSTRIIHGCMLRCHSFHKRKHANLAIECANALSIEASTCDSCTYHDLEFEVFILSPPCEHSMLASRAMYRCRPFSIINNFSSPQINWQLSSYKRVTGSLLVRQNLHMYNLESENNGQGSVQPSIGSHISKNHLMFGCDVVSAKLLAIAFVFL
jgi:hypothetical protein